MTHDYKTLLLTTSDNGICTLTLNRPAKHNALNAQMIGELRTAVKEIDQSADIRVVILAASGDSFCAGGDLGWMQEQVTKNRAGKIAESSQLASMLQEIDSLSKPVIGSVHGPAYGGGIGMMSVCDIVVASKDAKFALTETRLGLIPATIGPYVVRRMGEGAARQIFMNSMTFDSERAVHLGLVSFSVDPEDLNSRVQEQAEAFLDCAPGAVADAKALCQHLARSDATTQLAHTAEKLADRWETAEAKEGISSFFARSTPGWRS